MRFSSSLRRNAALNLVLANSPSSNNSYIFFLDRLVETLQWKGKIFVAGNGGSAADAQHFAAELICRLEKNRPGIAAIALTTDTSNLTAIGNDLGYDKVFSRQLEALATPNDIFLAISTSGNSPNILEALHVSPCPSLLLTGKDGGFAKHYAHHSLIVPGENSAEIQQLHEVILHSLAYDIEERIYGSL